MEYNTQKKKLILPEYGRNIQKMVDHLSEIEDKEERAKTAQVVIDVMGNLYPHLRDVPDFRHKLWDHLAIMSNFSLDIETPYPLPSIDDFYEKPEKLPYKNNNIKFRHFGITVEKLIAKLRDITDSDERRALIVLIANHMKKAYITWNRDGVEDEQILKNIEEIYGEKIDFPEDLELSSSKELLQNKNSKNKNSKNKKNNRTYRKKQY